MKILFDHTLRGFGQLLVANNRITGLCVLVGLFCLSIEVALMSLGGALLISALARWRAKDDAVLRTGLVSVNGALFGSLWLLLPHVPLWVQIITTGVGCAAMAFVFVPPAERLHERRSPYVLFSLPHVVIANGVLLALIAAGVHHAELTRGWRALQNDRNEMAERHFLNTAVSTDMAEAYRCAGLGWSLYRRGDQAGAQTAFSRVLSLKAGVADAYDGLGWSRLRQDRYDEAELAFRRSVALDSFHADSWSGLGWCAMRNGNPDEARRHFTTAALCAPLLAGAFRGLAETLPPGPNADFARRWSVVASGLNQSTQFISSRELICALWFFIGILWHSRTSAFMALTGLAVCLHGSTWIPAFGDPALAINIIAIFLALGGHYLRLNWKTFVWTLSTTLALALSWDPLSETLLSLGFLPLFLPFNLVLLGSLGFFAWLHGNGLRDERIPVDWTTSSPAQIRTFLAQKDLADASRSKLDQTRSEPPVPTTANLPRPVFRHAPGR